MRKHGNSITFGAKVPENCAECGLPIDEHIVGFRCTSWTLQPLRFVTTYPVIDFGGVFPNRRRVRQTGIRPKCHTPK
jgi:hypothetical protein